MATATFGGGCFWCTEAVFKELRGVERVVSGYAGGQVADPSYDAVCSGRTGHAEVVQVTYDPSAVSYRELLEVFFATHDPTTLNQQGADRGTQYRSTVLYEDEAQRHEAEMYHQNYACQNPNQGYIRGVAQPKVEKVRSKYSDLLKK